jgi:Xaa-Pro aminopeptidase
LLLGEAVKNALQRLQAATVGAELGHLPHTVCGAAANWFEIEDLLRELREIKDADELAAIELGIRTAEAAQAAAREILRPGLTELDVYAECVRRAILAAGSPFVMMCDVAGGPRAAQGGGAPTTRALQSGELLILDFFPYVEGYRGDITNTLVAGGKPTAEQEDLFHLVLLGLQAAEKTLRPGTPVGDVYSAIDRVFRDLKLFPTLRAKRELGHHAGHAIGLCHPEAPELVPDSDRTLEAGMVITLEPGIYGAPTGGIRLEHNYLITTEGHRRLSHHHLGLV